MKNDNNTIETIQLERLNYIDGLRGLAVILMLQQHLLPWLWNDPWMHIMQLWEKYPIIMTLNGLGGLAAPVFVVLAGLSSFFLTKRKNNPDKTFITRGVLILLFGYILNIATPSWFSPFSWYVLHMIGFALALTPLFSRTPTRFLLLVFITIIIITLILQSALNLPFFFNNSYMSSYDNLKEIFYVAIIRGNFPIFPWLAFYIAGILAGRWLIHDKKKIIAYFALALFLCGIILSSSYLLFRPADYDILIRLLKFTPSFNPANTPVICFLISIVMWLILLFNYIDKKTSFHADNPLVCLGRVSLTILMVHIIFFKEISITLHFYKIFSKNISVIIMISVIFIFSVLAVVWKKIEFEFSLEWLMRRVV